MQQPEHSFPHEPMVDGEQLARAFAGLEPAARRAAEAARELSLSAEAATVAARSDRSLAAEKSQVAEKAANEDLMYSLFGGPPRNRHERRKWAALLRKRGRG